MLTLNVFALYFPLVMTALWQYFSLVQRLTSDLLEVSSELAQVVSNQPILFG